MKVLRSIRVASRRRVAFKIDIWLSPNLLFICAAAVHCQLYGHGQTQIVAGVFIVFIVFILPTPDPAAFQ